MRLQFRFLREAASLAASGTVLLTTAQQEFTFETSSNAVYIIERMGKPLSNYTHERLTGTANNDAKRLTGSSATLGSFLDQTNR